MRRTLGLLAALAALAVAPAASAEQPPNPEAVRHFLEGKKLRDDGRCDLAVKELEASVKIEPSIGAHYNLGVCYEKTNKKLALANYKKAEEIAVQRKDDRLREIRSQRTDFMARTPHIRLGIPQPLPPDIKISVDGDILPAEDLQTTETNYFIGVVKPKYEVRVTAPGYEDWSTTVDKDKTTVDAALIPIVLRKRVERVVVGPATPPPETKWGVFQYGGLALIVLGAAGITYSSVSFITYTARESNLHQQFVDADANAKNCTSSSTDLNCPTKVETRERLRAEYNDNEQKANDATPIWLTLGIGGLLAVGGGIALIVAGPRDTVEPEPKAGDRAKAPRPTVRFLPQIGAREAGGFLTGTF